MNEQEIAMLAAIDRELGALGEQRLTAAELGRLDQLHTRGFASTVDLARLAGITRGARILDLGAGMGGPARYLAEAYDADVTCVDATQAFVLAAQRYTEAWSGDASRVRFSLGDALAVDEPDESFDVVWMQHVAMNIADRAGLYREVARLLRPGGIFVTYDIVAPTPDLTYPTPWAGSRDESTVIDESTMRALLAQAGLTINVWYDDSEAAKAWAQQIVTMSANGGQPGGAILHAIFGESARERVWNLARNLLEGRAHVAAVVAQRS